MDKKGTIPGIGGHKKLSLDKFYDRKSKWHWSTIWHLNRYK